MQIEEITSNRIIGIFGNSGSGKSSFLKYEESREVISINDEIKSSNVLTQIEYYVRKYNYRLSELEDRKDEIMKMLEIGDNVLDKNTYELSESELSKVLVASVLLCNPSTIILDDMLYSFDYRTKERILKLFIKLKKFFKKTIILISSNIDDLYEYIDDIIIIDEGKVLIRGEKSIIYDYYEHLIEKNIRVPFVVTFVKKMNEKGVKLDYVDSINELIKTLYREMR